MKVKALVLLFVLCFGVILSQVSVPEGAVVSHPLTAAAEIQVIGSDGCARLAGLAAGLALGTLTVCSILCAVGAWYTVGAIALNC